ncbi:hypothetical protein AB0K18_49570 [Nonomuraea sp. NPDC049421]|uniref:hypothetical protein n=1 Tax=Nonomuraea sp. NPDC049421 TaxID=3155275 RepID=UPI00344A7ACD
MIGKVRWLTGMVALPAVVLGGATLTVLAWRERLPADLPNKGGADGRPIVSTVTVEQLSGVLLGVPAILWLAGLAGFVLAGRAPASRAHWIRASIQVTVITIAVALAVPLLVILHAALDAPTAAQADTPSGAAMGVLVPLAALAGAVVAFLLAGRRTPAGRATEAPDPGAPRLDLNGQERATWQERRVIRAVDWAVAALVLAGMAMTAVLVLSVGSPGWAGATVVIVAVAFLPMRSYRLTIDERTVRVTLGLISREVALSSVRRADATDVQASRWLLDGALHGAGAGVVLLPGPALALRLADGTDFLASCRDAPTAASLINSMRDHQAA